ncbi:hypothetical protein OBBRIDRAFT_822971 [Obba rivulosa]|uniref:F-box domain-containing protein n=1 Tax=Obba rivulosa TaxID=1052685 RepID=A0A8E2DT01_9APHY|nr:hypothetical protein OBBRIDRAFT_822971 [Obba rivulosa]
MENTEPAPVHSPILQRYYKPTSPRRINELPTELLVNVLVLAADVEEPIGFRPFPKHTRLLKCRREYVTRIMLVCRYWRELALSTSQFWSAIFIEEYHEPRVVSRLLRRSKAAKLRVYMLLTSPMVLQAVVAHAHRLEELHVSVKKADLLSMVTYMDFAAPHLRHLSLCLPDLDPSGVGEDLTPLFMSSIGMLKTLHLMPFPGLMPHGYCTRLTHLRLSNQHALGGIDLNELLDLLEANPALEEIDFDGVAPFRDMHPIDRPPVSLRNLRLMVLKHYAWNELSLFLNHVGLSEDTHLLICDAEEVGESLDASFPFDVSHLENMCGVTKLMISYTAEGVFQLMAIGDGDRSSVWYDTGNAFQEIVIPEASIHFATLRSLSRVFVVEQLTELWIAFPDDMETPPACRWWDVLWPMQSLEKLRLILRDPGEVIGSLTAGARNWNFCCPSLLHLGISDDGSLFLEPIERLLRTRRRYGFPLLSLWLMFLAGPDVPKAHMWEIDRLKRLAPSVVGKVRLKFGQDCPMMSMPPIYEERLNEEFNLELYY